MSDAKEKKLPNFADEDDERDFWATHDSTEYIDWDAAQRARLPSLKPSDDAISSRLNPRKRRDR